MAENDELDLMFAAAGRRDVPSPDFEARILAAAVAMQPQPSADAPKVKPAPQAPGFWKEIWQTLGGWRATGGLSAAMLVGFWLGLSDPSGLLGQLGTTDSVELMPGTEDVFASLADEG